MNYKNILCPVDFTEDMESIIEIAISQCIPNGKITFFNYLETIDYEKESINFEKDTEFITSRKEEMEALVLQYKSKNPNITFKYEMTLDNNISEGIKHVSVLHNIDLIVMATHGRSGIKKLFMGSVAEEVIEAVNCPVLIKKI
jgi:nucleotide-binding universal stress UspA family protein